MQEISSKEYADLISQTEDNSAIGILGNLEEQFNKAYASGVIDATKDFMNNYKRIRDEFSSTNNGMTFESLDYFFSNIASQLMEAIKHDTEDLYNP